HPARRSGESFRRWRGHGSDRRGKKSRKGALHRIHRAQESGFSFEDAGGGGSAQVSLRRGADAVERDGRALQQLRQESVTCAGGEKDWRTGYEADGRWIDFAERRREIRRVLALRDESADKRGDHGMRLDGDSGVVSECGAIVQADGRSASDRITR